MQRRTDLQKHILVPVHLILTALDQRLDVAYLLRELPLPRLELMHLLVLVLVFVLIIIFFAVVAVVVVCALC